MRTLWKTLISPFRVVRQPEIMTKAFPIGADIIISFTGFFGKVLF